MTIKQGLKCIGYGGAIALFLFIPCNPVLAQITPDSTLGAEGSSILPNGVVIDGITADLIQDGASRGSALFHSFLEFNINEGQRVYFANPDGIKAIFSRVTGTDPSDILGTLGVNGAADLIFINPNGILFGENAQLDIRGSFIGSTANGVVFENGTIFSATNPEAPPLLTINVPLGLQYGNQNSAAITNSGNLEVGEDLTLVGGTISSLGQLAAPAGHLEIAAVNGNATVQDGLAQSAILWANNNLILEESQLVTAGDLILLAGDTVRVRDSVENPFIAHAGGNLYIQGNQSIDILALNHPGTPFQSGGDLSLVSNGVISGDAHFASGGQFAILNLAGEPGNFISLYDPIISSEGDVVLGDYTGVSLKVEARGSITTGNIRITGEDTTLTEGDDPDIEILRESPALILRAGVDELKNPPTTLIPVYSDDFEGDIPDVWSNTSTDITPKGNRRFLGRFSGNDAATLTLDNLPPHSQATVSFDLFLIQSWDGNAEVCCNGLIIGPDIWKLSITGGQTLLHTTFGNPEPNFPRDQAYPGEFPGGQYPGGTGSVNDELGYFSIDSVYQFSFPFLHNNGGLQLNFASALPGYTGIQDESWGLDNVRVSVQPIVTSSTEISPGTITAENLTTPGGPVILDASSNITINGLIKTNGGTLTLESGGVIDTTSGKLDSFSVNRSGGISITANSDIKVSEIFASSYGFSGNIDLTSHTGIIAVDGLYIIRSDAYGSIEDLGDTSSKQSGDINITARSLSLTNGARVLTGTLTNGVGGNLTVITSESVELSGTSPDGQILTALSTSNAGSQSAGNLTIETRRLIVRDGAVIGASTSNSGRGGNLTVNASELVELIGTAPNGFPSGLSTDTIDTGDAGNLTINTRRLVIRDGAAVSASTFSEGQGGSLTVNASESIELSGTSPDGFASGLYAQAFGDGDAGNLTINHTQNLNIRHGAKITVATGTAADARVPNVPSFDFGDEVFLPVFLPTFESDATGNAGNAEITADFIRLNNQAAIIAETDSSEGGNITLNVNDILLLRHNSSISTTAGTAQAGGNGGNIRINSPFVVGLPWENSDITANAFFGNGGRVDITANKIYGLEFRPRLTPLSDITASSEFGEQGVVELNTLEIDPDTGLMQLPPPASPPEFVNFCQGRSDQTPSHFIISGRGGVPPTISQVTGTDNVWEDLRPLTPSSDNSPAKIEPVTQRSSTPIIEAQGWIKLPDGTIVLTAQAPNITPNTGWQNPINCQSAVK
ncbi:MAG: filamentous hemagglutinin N-terminal domain-containing protein [Coleofasciculus chthonoplastes F3-SA18-01]|uniref:two-partner secretion domain-containing protein n=1 Tax=Coleofasciculus chthonoplastes TaxID=64178 RepID=UPI00330525A6